MIGARCRAKNLKNNPLRPQIVCGQRLIWVKDWRWELTQYLTSASPTPTHTQIIDEKIHPVEAAQGRFP